MSTRSFAITSRLLRVYQAQARNLVHATRYQRTNRITNSHPSTQYSPLTTSVWRRSNTTEGGQTEGEGQIEPTSTGDKLANIGIVESSTVETKEHNVTDNSSQQPSTSEDTAKDANQPEQPSKRRFNRTHEKAVKEAKFLTKGHVSTQEEVSHRLTTLLTSFNDQHLEGQHPVIEAAEDVYVTRSVWSGSTVGLEVRFDRIAKANSLNTKMMTDLNLVFQALNDIKDVAMVTLTSAPPPEVPIGSPRRAHIFSAGADVRELSQIETPAEAEEFIRTISRLCTSIRDLPAPVLALIDGPCIGGGLEIAAACDLRWASRDARFAMPEVLLGIPSVVEARLLCEIVGWSRARQLMLTGETWDVDTAYNCGLITKQFDRRTIMAVVARGFAGKVASKPQVYKAQKRLMRIWETSTIDQGIEAGVKAFVEVWQNEDMKRVAKIAMEDVFSKKAVTVSAPREKETATEVVSRESRGTRISKAKETNPAQTKDMKSLQGETTVIEAARTVMEAARTILEAAGKEGQSLTEASKQPTIGRANKKTSFRESSPSEFRIVKIPGEKKIPRIQKWQTASKNQRDLDPPKPE